MSEVLKASDVHVAYPVRTAWGKTKQVIKAVDGLSLTLAHGETVGLVGESGCGKSTFARAIVRLVEPSAGEILVNGKNWRDLTIRELRPLRPQVQMVFQDPYNSLNPRMRIGDILEEPLVIHRRGSREERQDKVVSLLEQVGLAADDRQKYPHQFSGGQRQRIGIARAIILEPDLLIADEAVSALDVTIQAQILELLDDLQKAHGHSMLFISHDLRVVEQISDRVCVMYAGKFVEQGLPEKVFHSPDHDYTRKLLAALPKLPFD